MRGDRDRHEDGNENVEDVAAHQFQPSCYAMPSSPRRHRRQSVSVSTSANVAAKPAGPGRFDRVSAKACSVDHRTLSKGRGTVGQRRAPTSQKPPCSEGPKTIPWRDKARSAAAICEARTPGISEPIKRLGPGGEPSNR